MTKPLNPPFFFKFVRRLIIPLILVVVLIFTGTLVLNSYIPRTSAYQIVVINIPKTTGATTATGVVCEETPEATIHLDEPRIIVLETTATTEEKINLTTAYWNLKLYVEIWKNETLEQTVEFGIIKEGVIFIDGLEDSCSLLAGDYDVVVKADYETMPVTETISGTFTIEIKIVELQPRLWIWKHGAKVWPEWQVGYWNDTQILYARIINTGTLGVYVKAEFILTYQLRPIHRVNSTIAKCDGAPPGNVTVSAEYHPPLPGTYYFKAKLWFSYDADHWRLWLDVQDELGGEGVSKTASSKFKVHG